MSLRAPKGRGNPVICRKGTGLLCPPCNDTRTGSYYVYFNMVNFPQDLESAIVSDVKAEEGAVNTRTIILKSSSASFK